jgi:hypothetical protein
VNSIRLACIKPMTSGGCPQTCPRLGTRSGESAIGVRGRRASGRG